MESDATNMDGDRPVIEQSSDATISGEVPCPPASLPAIIPNEEPEPFDNKETPDAFEATPQSVACSNESLETTVVAENTVNPLEDVVVAEPIVEPVETIIEEKKSVKLKDQIEEKNEVVSPPSIVLPPQVGAKSVADIVSTSLPSKLIRIAVNDELERLRITSSVSLFLEEVVEGDSLKSKHLLKLSHIYNQTSKVGLLPSLSSIVEELLKASILTVGKHTGSFAANVKQGVCIMLPEFVKNSKKRIQTTYNKIVAIQDEIKRTKVSYARLLEKQQRTIKEAEQTLLAANNEEEISTPKDEGRRFTKMISKIAGEKKGLERYHEILKELESIEYQMQSDWRRINVSRSEMMIEISKAFKELEEQEVDRLQVMREGIDRFLLALDLTIKSQLDAFSPAEMQLSKLDLRGEIDAFLGRTASTDGGPYPSVFQAFELDSEKSKYSMVIQQVSIKADRMAEILDFFQNLTQRLVQCVNDAESAESVDLKASSRAIEKTGFPRLPVEGDLFENSRVNSGLAQLLHEELPMTRKQWGALLNIIGHLVEAYSRTIDYYSEETSQQFDLIQKRIVMCKKDLTEKHTTAMKKIEACLQDVGRIRVKLTKLRSQIKERKQTLRTIKGGGNSSDPNAIGDDDVSDVAEDDTQETASVSSAASGGSGSAPATPGSSAAAAFAAVSRRANMVKAFESFNSTLRGAANLKQVVGLETAADRINRVEAQITQLEEEERQTIEFEKHAIRVYEECLSNCHRDLEQSVSLTVEIFLADVDTLKRALSKYLNWQKEKFSIVISSSKELKESITISAVDIREDYRVVYNNLLTRNNFFEGELFEIPPGEVFEGHKLERFDDDDNGDASTAIGGAGGNENDSAENGGEDGSGANSDRRTGSDDFGSAQESPSKQLQSAEFELKKFGLSSQDKVLESYSCALYPKKGLLTHGRMFVTQHFIAFSGWPDTRVLLQMGSVEKLEKMNTLMYIPNAISIITNDKEEYFFGSFIDRDQCYYLIKNLLEVEKRIVELHGTNEAVASRKLEYGYLAKTLTVPSMSTKILGSALSAATPSKDQENKISSDAAASSSDLNSDAVANSEAVEDEASNELDIFKEVSINFGSTFTTGALIELSTMKFDVPAKKIFQTCWQNVVDYETYLTNSGDFDIRKEDWKSLSTPVVEDVCKMNFSFSRELNYQHPRTTMLMFGPKNAPTKQTHYFYVPLESNGDGSDFTIENIAKSKINKFAILFITQFDGVPMADVFKVLQYQFYENVDNKCTVRIGLQMHYIKSSMFKGQIMSGTKEELGSQIASWLEYVRRKSCGGAKGAITAGTDTGAAAVGASTGGEASAGPGSAVYGAQAPPQDLSQQLISAALNNIPLLVMFILVVLFFFTHVFYTRSQIAFLTRQVNDLEHFQRDVLVGLIEKVKSSRT